MESEFRPGECSLGELFFIVQHGVAYQRRRFCPPTPVADEASTPPICAAYPSSISSLTSCVRLTPPTVRTILAGSFSLPLRRPASIASRTAFSISRCEVMPTFFRNLRRLALKTSSFMVASCCFRSYTHNGSARTPILRGCARDEARRSILVIARSKATKQSIFFRRGANGLLRGACHRARVRATRWLAMTGYPVTGGPGGSACIRRDRAGGGRRARWRCCGSRRDPCGRRHIRWSRPRHFLRG